MENIRRERSLEDGKSEPSEDKSRFIDNTLIWDPGEQGKLPAYPNQRR
jgi:hypothetical protein